MSALPLRNSALPLNYAYKPGQADDGVTLDVSVREAEVTIVARSNGCTQKEDFRFIVRDRGEDPGEHPRPVVDPKPDGETVAENVVCVDHC